MPVLRPPTPQRTSRIFNRVTSLSRGAAPYRFPLNNLNDYPQKYPHVARTSPKPTFIVELFCTPSEGVGFSRISLLLWKEWNCCGASVCAVEPFSVCRSFLLLRKESAFCAFLYSFGRSGIAAVPLYALWNRFSFAVPSYSFGRSRLFAHFPTPSEGVEFV